MKKFKTYTSIMGEYTDTASFACPPFSKLLDIRIDTQNGIPAAITALIEIDTTHEYDEEKKSFLISIRKGSDLEFMAPGYEYVKAIEIEKAEIISNSSGYGSGASININLVSAKTIYSIFVSEIKSRAENRDEKIEEIIK